jgi:3-methyladenine DNA glycosylase AlkC
MPTADELLGDDSVAALIATLRADAPRATLPNLRRVRKELGPLPLRQRADAVKDALLADLPGDYNHLERVIRSALAHDSFTGWLIWPVTEAVAAKALEDGSAAAFDAGLRLLADLTGRLTAEFAIRPMLEHDLDRALRIIGKEWTCSPDEHVRRLASEGTRAFLPWAKRVPAILAQPKATIPIIDALYRDESDYVRRSVANHLNDLSRQQPQLTVETAARWLDKPDANTARLVRHALRTLVKSGRPDALALLGYPAPEGIQVGTPHLSDRTVAVGGELPFTVTIGNTAGEPARLAIDYVVHHVKANGSQTTKVFKLTTATLGAGETLTLSRRHSFKEITTRRYHPGTHAIQIQVNGVVGEKAEFELTTTTKKAGSPAR